MGKKTPSGPFASAPRSRAEARMAKRRSKNIHDAWARAMPAPDPGLRVDPFTGQAPIGEQQAPRAVTPIAPSAERQARPVTPGTPTKPAGYPASGAPSHHAHAAQPWTPPTTPAAPAAQAARQPTPDARHAPEDQDDKKPRRIRLRRAPEPSGNAGLPSLADATLKSERPPLVRRATAQVDGRAGTWCFFLGLLALVVCAVGSGMSSVSLLGSPANYQHGAIGAAGALVAALALWRGHGAVPMVTKVTSLLVATLLLTSFGVGLATNPVVVDGKVHLATSKTAKSAQMLSTMREDLFALTQYDALLAAPQEDARAMVARYAPAQAELTEMSSDYAKVATDLPDPSFAAPAEKLKTASYWASKAMQLKLELIQQDDAKKSADLDSYRATYASELLAGGEALASAAATTGIPLTDLQEGPTE